MKSVFNPCEIHGDQAMSDRIANQFAARFRALADDLLYGTLSLEDWHSQMMEGIRLAFIEQAIAGAYEGDERMITSADMRRIERDIERQYEFLDNFAADIEKAVLREGASLNFIPARAALYAQSSSAEYWRQATDVDLPNVPGDGSTQCLGNCTCSIRLECEYDAIGSVVAVLAFWELDPLHEENHCPDCPRRAMEWNPLRIAIAPRKAA